MIETIIGQLEKVRKSGKGYIACCPAHNDRRPSLSISEGDDGRILLYCFAGCTVQNICKALGIEVKDLFPDGQGMPLKQQSDALRKRKLHKKYEILKNRSFLAMADFRDNLERAFEKDQFDIPPDITRAVHDLPLIEHYMQVLATGSDDEQVELLRNGVIFKWAKLFSKKKI
jgi:hypothetical protein